MPKVFEALGGHRVNVSYAKPDDQRYVSVSGTAQLVRNLEKMKELWNPIFKAWFPEGLDDPELALLKVQVEKAEIWDAPSGKVVQLAGFIKSLATGERFEGGENKKLDL